MDDVDEIYTQLFWGLLVLWLLPWWALGGVVLLLRAAGSAWRTRGLEQGCLYCPGCRFDLRGCASWNCPECGTHLDDGRVLTTGYERPMGLGARLLLVSLGVAGPLVLLGVVLATAVPANYATTRRVELKPIGLMGATSMRFVARGERAWWGRGTPTSLELNSIPWRASLGRDGQADLNAINRALHLPLTASDSAVFTEKVWEGFEIAYRMSEASDAWRTQSRKEIAAVLRYLAGQGASPLEDLQHYRAREWTSRQFDVMGWFVLVELTLALLAWVFVLRWTVRWHDRVWAIYAADFARVGERLTARIERTRLGTGLDRNVHGE